MNGSNPYISLSEAGKISGYTAEYLRQLCVKGKLEGVKIGKSWVTTEAAVTEFKARQTGEPVTLDQVVGTSVFSYSKAQKLAATAMAVLVFLPVAANLTRLSDRVATLKDKTSQLVVSTENAFNRRISQYIREQLQELGIKNQESQSQPEVAGSRIENPISQISNQNSEVSSESPAEEPMGQVLGETVSNEQVLEALRAIIFNDGLPEDLKLALKGEKGEAGAAGITTIISSATIPNSGSVFGTTAPAAQNPGTIGSATYLSSREFYTETLSVTAASSLHNTTINGDLILTGNLSLTGNATLTGDLLPGTDDTYALGSLTQRWNSLRVGTATSSFAGAVGIGTTSPTGKLNILSTTEQLRLSYDDSNFSAFTISAGGNLLVSPSGGTTTLAGATGLVLSGNDADLTFTGTGNHDITAAGGTLRIGSNTIIGNIEALDDTVDIGTPATRFDKIYANEVNATTLVGTITGGNVSAETLNLNSDNATADTEDAFLAFERGSVSPNALLQWDSTNDRFNLNSGVSITNTIGSAYGLLVNGGNVGIGTTGPADLLQLHAAAGSNPTFKLTDADVAHGITQFGLTTDSIFRVQNVGGTQGGAWLTGASSDSSSHGLILNGIIGVTDPNDATPAILLSGSKKSGANRAALGALETVLQVENGNTTAGTILLTILGSGNVGIGTTNPLKTLDVQAVSASAQIRSTTIGNSAYMVFTANAGSNFYIGRENTSGGGLVSGDTASAAVLSNEGTAPLQFANNGSVVMTILNGGNVGIGTAIPGSKLEVVGAAAIGRSNTLVYSPSDPATFNKVISLTRSGGALANRNILIDFDDAGSAVGNFGIIQHSTPLPYADFVFNQYNGSAYAETMRIDYTGNVGIGTTGPLEKLHVAASQSGKTTIGASRQLILDNTNGNVGQRIEIGMGVISGGAYPSPVNLGHVITNASQGTIGDFYIALRDVITNTAPVERFYITAAGNVGIGTTNPGSLLHVETNTSAGARLTLKNTSASANFNAAIELNAVAQNSNARWTIATGSTDDSASAGDLYFRNTVQGRGSLLLQGSTGNVGIGTTNPAKKLHVLAAGPSQLRLETSTAGAGRGLEFVDNGAANYNWYVGGHFNVASALEFTPSTTSSSTTYTTPVMVIQAGGNVGIGTTSPGGLLNLGGSVTSTTPNALLINATVTSSGAGSSSNLGVYLNPTMLPAPNDYSRILNITGNFTEAASGAHGDLASVVINTPTVTAGVGTVTNTYGLYIGGAMSATVTGGNYALYSNSGTNYFGGNVGIGTTSPGSKFALNGLDADTSLHMTLSIAGVAKGYFGPATTGNPIITGVSSGDIVLRSESGLVFSSGGATERMRIASGGNVGIGTTNPFYKFDVQGTSNTVAIRAQSNTAGDILYYGTGTVTGSINFIQSAISATGAVQANIRNANTTSSSADANIDLSVNGANAGDPFLVYTVSGVQNWAVGIDNSDSDKFKISPTGSPSTGSASLTIDTSGNVGIGTTNPSGKLEIFAANTQGILAGYNTSNSNRQVLGVTTSSSNGILTLNDSTPTTQVQLHTSGVSYFNGGSVGIGTTAPGTAFSTLFEVAKSDSTGQPMFMINNSAAAGSNRLSAMRFILNGVSNLLLGHTGGGSVIGDSNAQSFIASQVSGEPLTFFTGGIAAANERMRIDGSGNVGIGTTNPSNPLHVVGAGRITGNLAVGGAVETTIALDVTGSITASADQIGARIYPTFTSAATGSGTGVLSRVATAAAVYTMGNSYAFFAQTPAIGAGSAITNNYGVFIADQDPAGVGTGYGIYQNTSTNLNYFAGNIGIGSVTPGTALDVARTSADSIIRSVTTTSGVSRLDLRGYNATTTLTDFMHLAGSQIILVNKNATNGNFTSIFNQSDAGVQGSGIAFINDNHATGAGSIAFMTQNGTNLTEKMRINSTGYVGIGTTNPGVILDVQENTTTMVVSFKNTKSSGQGDVILTLDKAATGNSAAVRFNTGGSIKWQLGTGLSAVDDNFRLRQETLGVDVLTSYTSGAVANTLVLNAGNVGVGTASPSIVTPYASVVDIRGTTTDQNFGGSVRLASNNGTTTNSYISVSTNGLDINNTKATPIRLFTNNTEKVSILSGGNVGIGSTNPGAKLDIITADANPALRVTGNSANFLRANTSNATQTASANFYSTDAVAADKGGLIYFGGNYTGTTGTNFAGIGGYKDNATDGEYGGYLSLYTRTHGSGPAERIRINSSGNVGIGTTNPGKVLDVVGPAGANGAFLVRTATNGQGAVIFKPDYASGKLSIQGTNSQLSAAADLLINPEGGNVAIGTTGPNTMLEINTATAATSATTGAKLRLSGNGNTGFSAAEIQLFDRSADTNWNIGIRDASDDGSFRIASGSSGANTSDRLTILTGGNVGIGTTNPLQKLHVSDGGGNTSLGATQILVGSAANVGQFAGIGFGWQGSSNAAGSIGLIATDASGSVYGDLIFNTRAVTTDTAPTEKMRISSSGSVGIGDTSPTEGMLVIAGSSPVNTPLLYIGGNAQATTGTAYAQRIASKIYSTSGTGTISEAYGLKLDLTTDDSALAFVTSSLYHISITDVDTPGSDSVTNQYGLFIDTLNDATNNWSIYTGTAQSLFQGNVSIGSDPTPDFALDVTGDINSDDCFREAGVQVAGTCASDSRLKHNISSLSGSLDRILRLRPVEFEWNENIETLGGTMRYVPGRQVGLIAQEMQEVFPHLVKEKNGYLAVEYNLELQMAAISAIQEIDNKTAGNYLGSGLAIGDLVKFDEEMNGTVVRSLAGDNSAGVINSVAGGVARVQYVGQTQVKFSEENGQIYAGDRLTLSSQIPGAAAKMTQSGQSIGTALEDSDGSGTGIIQAFVSIGYQKVDIAQNSQGELVAMEQDLDLGGNAILNVKSIAGLDGKWSISEEGLLVVKEVHTEKLCVGLTCVTEDELKTLLQTAGINNAPAGGSGEGDGGTVSGDSTPPQEETPPAEEPPVDPGAGEEPPPVEEPPVDQGEPPPPPSETP